MGQSYSQLGIEERNWIHRDWRTVQHNGLIRVTRSSGQHLSALEALPTDGPPRKTESTITPPLAGGHDALHRTRSRLRAKPGAGLAPVLSGARRAQAKLR